VASAGLKLREERPGRPHLIQFERADEPQQRESRYRIIEVEYGPMLSAALAAAIGVRVVVTKHRRLFLWHDVPFVSTSTMSSGSGGSSSSRPWRRQTPISLTSTSSSPCCAMRLRSPTSALSQSATQSSYEPGAPLLNRGRADVQYPCMSIVDHHQGEVELSVEARGALDSRTLHEC
jgi:hypothetical protein